MKEQLDEVLAAYGSVSGMTGSLGYFEDNEIRCAVKSAPANVVTQITNNIARDWDNQNHGGMRYKIKGVYKVSGLAVNSEFTQISQNNYQKKGYMSGRKTENAEHLQDGQTKGGKLFYHGTGSFATSMILGHSGEFKVGKAKVGRMLGNGIYLADKASKSAQYISDAGYSRKGGSGSLMIVEASLGNVTDRGERGYRKDGWGDGTKGIDTAFGGKNTGLANNEWCVNNPKAVIPRYLVEMELL